MADGNNERVSEFERGRERDKENGKETGIERTVQSCQAGLPKSTSHSTDFGG